jgi:hypothetical protein
MQDGAVGTDKTSSSEKENNNKISMRRGKTAKSGITENQNQHDYIGEEKDEWINVQRMMSPPEMYISRIWAMVATAASITGVFISMYMLVYVLQRMCDGTLR